ncbi:sulfatase/phosphatase domain-containing protein [Pontiella sulfatireligans]|uniref:N-sulphoglucosamine sulphohydrolase C-terminal domain-containing protein n=1 Tax=Pontiella sulfatireligans TaxID=2750658 RepID=A0A6C2UL58_9BACT|nr:sulfatase/phosphatase domain-containing protein [Pontiella sulfatireligans]VGO20972.1 hypothetical protein SCARR_03039 [Pontiella sulfatireligans]
MEEIDYNAARVLDHLKKQGIEQDTIVIFTSDNGSWLSKGRNGGSAKPLFEGKFTGFEGGQCVPCVVCWPDTIPAGSVCSEMAFSIDLLPTLANISGTAVPDGIDGKDILGLWKDQGAKTPHDHFFYVFQGKAVRSGKWKYHRKEVFKVKETTRESDGPTLYNLEEDIGEANNVIDEHPEVAERLDRALQTHLDRISKKN